MSDRNQQILRQLVINNKTPEEELLKKFDLTARQLAYSIEAINDRLADKGLPLIEKKQGAYVSSRELANYLVKHQTIKDVVFSADDRIFLIVIMVLTRTEELSLSHFIFDLGISKNTVVSDIKKTKEFLDTYHLTIDFTRKDGYVIIGTEWDKRRVLSQAIIRIYRAYGEKITAKVMGSSSAYADAVKRHIQEIEKFLSVKYNDEYFYPLVYFISALLVRAQRGNVIEGNRFSDSEEIESTKEFQSMFLLSGDLPELSSEEKHYLALQLLSANVQNKGALSGDELPSLANALWEFLNEFESNTYLVISDKKVLLNKLLNHFKPAYYRIKYNLSDENVLYEIIKDEYRVLHDFVKQSIKPLEEFFGTEISDQEIAYITLFVGGHLIANEPNDFEDKVIKAVIVCPNGISMSKIIEKKLKVIFPEFLFYPASSIREYKKFILPHDLVFSTVPLEAERKVFVINEVLSASDQLQLRMRVIKEVYSIDFEGINARDILRVVKQYAKISNEEKLLEELDNLLRRDAVAAQPEDPKVSAVEMNDVITGEYVTIEERQLGWEEALKKAMIPLLKNGIVQEEFERMVLSEYKSQPEYILLQQRVILPHMDPALTPQKLGISVVVAKEGIVYNGKEIKLLIVLTTPDKTSHLNLLYGISRIAKNENTVEKLCNMDTATEIADLLKTIF